MRIRARLAGAELALSSRLSAASGATNSPIKMVNYDQFQIGGSAFLIAPARTTAFCRGSAVGQSVTNLSGAVIFVFTAGQLPLFRSERY
jgi:hypothetical protein